MLSSQDAEKEYKAGQHALHLHMKKPVMGRLVMRNLGPMTLGHFLNYNHHRRLTPPKKLALTKALLKAYNEQVVELGLIHRDLHPYNILLQVDPKKPDDQFKVNIIDYGLAILIKELDPNDEVYHKKLKITRAPDFRNIIPIIQNLWDYPEETKAPKIIKEFFSNGYSHFDDYLLCFNNIIVAPTLHTQKSIDKLLDFLEELKKSNPQFSDILKITISKALKTSNPLNMKPLKDAVLSCRDILASNYIEHSAFPFVAFEENENRQRVLNRIGDFYQKLEMKAKALKRTHSRESEQLDEVVHQLKEDTWKALYSTKEGGMEKLQQCQIRCRDLLNEKENQSILAIHRDHNYLWKEIAVILASLVVLYPLVFGVNYICTHRMGIFSETESTKGAIKLDQDFDELINELKEEDTAFKPN